MGGYLEGGIEDAGALTDQVRKTAAYNAFSNSYGPGAAYAIVDPQAALGAQEVAQRQQTNPIAVQQASANLAGTQADTAGKQLANTDTQQTQQRMAAYRGAQMLLSQADPQTGAIPPDAYDKIVRPNAALFGIDPAHVDDFGHLLSQPGGAGYVHQVSQALIGPTKVTGAVSYGLDANGNPVAITKDQYGNIHQQSMGGTVATQQQTANTGAKKVPIAQENADTNRAKLPILQQNANANTYRANTTSNNSLFGNPNGQLPGDNRPSANAGGGNTLPAPSVDKIGAGNPPGTTTAPAVPPTSLFAKLPPKGRGQALSQANQIVNAGTQLSNSLKILDTVDKQISPYTAGTGTLLKSLPGSAQADLKANLATLKAQGLMAWISSLKNASGQTGIGRVLQSEANAAGNLYGNMEQDQSAKQLAFHAQLFRQAVTKLYQHSQQGFQAMYGVAPHDALGTSDPMAPPAPGLPSGWKYLGPKK